MLRIIGLVAGLALLGGCVMDSDQGYYQGGGGNYPGGGYAPARGYAPQGYAQQGYAPQGYTQQGYAPRGYAPQPAPQPFWNRGPPPPPLRYIPGAWGPQVGTGYTRSGYAEQSPHPFGHWTRQPNTAETHSVGN